MWLSFKVDEHNHARSAFPVWIDDPQNAPTGHAPAVVEEQERVDFPPQFNG